MKAPAANCVRTTGGTGVALGMAVAVAVAGTGVGDGADVGDGG
jgi:hypothetical protein